MKRLRVLFFTLLVRPLVFGLFGVHIRHAARLPQCGPAIVVANHNSHLDTLVLMSLFARRLLHQIRPVAAADYFSAPGVLHFVSVRLCQAILLERQPHRGADGFKELAAALAAGNILILYPEGTRGEPEKLAAFKSGIAHLAERFPEVPVVPVFTHGIGKALPRHDWLLVPFFIDIFVGEALFWQGSRRDFMLHLQRRMLALAGEGQFPAWD